LRTASQVLDATGAWSEIFAESEAGAIELGIRYFDPVSGRYGLTRFVHYTIV
jgi:hypothetical protein